MANTIKMALTEAIKGLISKGWSYRRISRELGVHRDTVSRHDPRKHPDPKPANLPTGSGMAEISKPTKVPAGSEVKVSTQKSQCVTFAEIIQSKLNLGLTAQRIWQDIRQEHDFTGGYDSVKRYVRKICPPTELPYRRMECLPGEEANVDFGQGACIKEGKSKKKSYVLRVQLSHSRKGYSEATYHQTTENFIRILENTFWEWGGVPKTIRLDNMKAAVQKADWYDPDINPKILDFARHYNTVFLPIKSYTPRHNGKAESGIKYVKGNGLKGRKFENLQGENQHLREWEEQIADTRIHGTTKKQVKKIFEEVERGQLQPLPAERFPLYQEGWRSVHRDAHVEVDKAYYSVPPEYLDHRLLVRWDSRFVRIFSYRNLTVTQVAVHAKKDLGNFSTLPEHLLDKKISGVERGAEYLLEKISKIGFDVLQWAKEMLNERGIEGIRVLQGLLSLAKQYPCLLLQRACQVSSAAGSYRLKTLRTWLAKNKDQMEFDFASEHPIIRPLTEYQAVIPPIKFQPKERKSA